MSKRFTMTRWLSWMPQIYAHLEVGPFSIRTAMFYEACERMVFDVFRFSFRAFKWSGEIELVYPPNFRK